MGIEFLDPLLKFVPGVKKPSVPLSFKDKLKWTAVIMSIYFLMFSTPAFGVLISSLKNPTLEIINTIFAARLGSLVTVGIGPIVLSSIVLQLLNGAGVIKMDLNNPEDKGRFQAIQKLAAIIIAVIEAFIFASTGAVQLINPSFFIPVVIQFVIGAVVVIYLDETMVKYGITSGINLFIAGGVAYSIIGGTFNILLPLAASQLAQGTATAIPQAVLAFLPLAFTILVFLISLYVLEMKIELPLVFSQFRGVGGRLPIPFLYVSVLPVILATSLLYSLSVWFLPISHIAGSNSILQFLAVYTNQSGTQTISGGLIYLMQPNFPVPYTSGYGTYIYQLETGWSPLTMPTGGPPIEVPTWAHFVIYLVVLVCMCVIFGKFWVEMTGQSPKKMAEQLQDVGWQIPGFRRDPRVIEGVLNNYLPTITILGSIFVGILAAFATISGAIGGGMGVLLTAGIMYAIYQQLERENLIESFPALNNLLSK
jgi:preprotein translocase subunit SecY